MSHTIEQAAPLTALIVTGCLVLLVTAAASWLARGRVRRRSDRLIAQMVDVWETVCQAGLRLASGLGSAAVTDRSEEALRQIWCAGADFAPGGWAHAELDALTLVLANVNADRPASGPVAARLNRAVPGVLRGVIDRLEELLDLAARLELSSEARRRTTQAATKLVAELTRESCSAGRPLPFDSKRVCRAVAGVLEGCHALRCVARRHLRADLSRDVETVVREQLARRPVDRSLDWCGSAGRASVTVHAAALRRSVRQVIDHAFDAGAETVRIGVAKHDEGEVLELCWVARMPHRVCRPVVADAFRPLTRYGARVEWFETAGSELCGGVRAIFPRLESSYSPSRSQSAATATRFARSTTRRNTTTRTHRIT